MTTRTRSTSLVLFALAFPLATGGACKGDDSSARDTAADRAPADVAAPDVPADHAPTDVPAPDVAADHAPADVAPPDDTGGGCDASRLTGVWLSANYSVRFAADLSYEAAGAPNLTRIDVTGQAAVDGCRITFGNEAGTYACPDSQPGRYTFTVTATSLALTLVSDACEGRQRPLSGAVLTRE